MNLTGSTIDFPFRADSTGTFVTTDRREELITQAIQDIIDTRQGERVMAPDYGVPDLVFQTQTAAFAHRLAYHLEEQIIAYVPMVKATKIRVATVDNGRAEVHLQYQETGEVNAPKNLVFPVWRYSEAA